MTQNQKLRPSDYADFDQLPLKDKEKILRAIARRIRRAARASRDYPHHDILNTLSGGREKEPRDATS